VIINSVIFIAFAASFFHPANRRDWKAMGAFSAFVVALFTEMYGFPLTIYLLTGVFGSRVGGDLTHDGGHLWAELIGWKGDPHFSPFHLASYFFIAGGLYLPRFVPSRHRRPLTPAPPPADVQHRDAGGSPKVVA